MSALHTLRQGGLSIAVNTRGAELWSICRDGQEYLWQGDPTFWGDRAPNLFPYIARLTNGSYTLHGRPYRMDIHGFIKDQDLTARQDGDSLIFEFAATPATLAQYPFDHVFRVIFRLADPLIHISYEVENHASETMFFGLGGHPGFRLPLESALSFDDYSIVFSAPCTPRRILFSPDILVCGDTPYPLEQDTTIPLCHSLFDDDAIILSGTSGAVRLASEKGNRAVTVRYEDFPYLGLWHIGPGNAPYLCIEPWSSLPARQGIIEELTEQPGLLQLPAGARRRYEWSIEIT